MNVHQILLNLIFDKLIFHDKHTFKRINKYTKKMKIIDLYNIDCEYSSYFDDDILMNYIDATKLNAKGNRNITDVNHMTKLKVLRACGSCGINNKGIINLNDLEILNVGDNSKITNINHMIKLKELYACGSCGINNAGLINIKNLEILAIRGNQKITKEI